MEGLIAQLRAAMVLMLVSALALAWAATRSIPDIRATVIRLANSGQWPEQKVPQAIREYRSHEHEDFSVDRWEKLLQLVPQEALTVETEIKDRLANMSYVGGPESEQAVMRS